MLDLKTFYGPNAGYVLDLYERYKQNPAWVDAATRALFETWSPNSAVAAQAQAMAGPPGTSTQWLVSHVAAAAALAHAIRERGHLGAHLDPLGREPVGDPALLPETHSLSEEDLAHLPPLVVGGHVAEGARNALEAIQALRAMYSGTISYEFDQVKSADERMWLRDAVGLHLYHRTPSAAEARALLKRLTQVEVFERYLHQTFPGQKRFSMELRSRRKDSFKERHNVSLGFMSFFTKATVGALKAFPRLNAEIEGNEMVLKYYYDIGIAVGAEEGLVVPVLRDADRKSFADIEREIAELAKRARENRLSLAELQGGTFTITNGGVFGSLLSTPILNAPQVGILGMHKIEQRPVVVSGQIVIRPMMYVALSYDHRIVDGSEAVQFLVRIKELVEDPETLLLEG